MDAGFDHTWEAAVGTPAEVAEIKATHAPITPVVVDHQSNAVTASTSAPATASTSAPSPPSGTAPTAKTPQTSTRQARATKAEAAVSRVSMNCVADGVGAVVGGAASGASAVAGSVVGTADAVGSMVNNAIETLLSSVADVVTVASAALVAGIETSLRVLPDVAGLPSIFPYFGRVRLGLDGGRGLCI